MNLAKLLKHLLILSFLGLLFSFTSYNSSTKELEYYLKQMDMLLKYGGSWKTHNSEFKSSDEWSPNYFGYEYSKGINANTIKLKITGYFPKKSVWLTYWEGVYSWDFNKQKVIYESVNSEGAIARGESEQISENQITLLFSITQPDGKIENHKDVQILKDDQIQSQSFILRSNKWEEKGSKLWTILEQPKGTLGFMTTRDGNFEIYTINLNDNTLKNLSCNIATDYAFSYFDDGSKISFYSDRDGNDEIYLMNSDGKKQMNISKNPAQDRIPVSSPDGKQILFISDRDHKKGELYIMDIEGKNVKRLTNNEAFEDGATWSPDGKKIVFTRELKDKKDTASHSVGNGEIFVINIDGTNEIRLTNRPGFDDGAKFSPDGKKIAFYGMAEDGNYELFLMDTNGNGIANLTQDPLEDYSPAWSSDGKWIAYTNGNSKNYDVWLINLETKIKTRLTTQTKRDESPFWFPPEKNN